METIEDDAVSIELPANVWAWLDLFRNGRSLNEVMATALIAGREDGDSPATTIGMFVCTMFEERRRHAAPGTPFAPEFADRLQNAARYLPYIDLSESSRHDPEFWWFEWSHKSGQTWPRVLAFDDETREVTLPMQTWMLVDLFEAERGNPGLEAYTAVGDEEPDRVARALCALAKLQFDRMKADGTHPLFAARFKAEIEAATRHLAAL